MTVTESIELVNAELPELRGYCENLQRDADDFSVAIKIASRKQILAEILRLQHNLNNTVGARA